MPKNRVRLFSEISLFAENCVSAIDLTMDWNFARLNRTMRSEHELFPGIKESTILSNTPTQCRLDNVEQEKRCTKSVEDYILDLPNY